jgi:hypothetical protein
MNCLAGVTGRRPTGRVSPLRVAAVVSALVMLIATQFVVLVQPSSAAPPTATVLVPSNMAAVSGAKVVLDASAPPGTTHVLFVAKVGSHKTVVIRTAVPTIYGWIALWNSMTVPNGTYSLHSVADANGKSATSAAITITVDNVPPSTSVLIPSGGASVSGTTEVLDASASSAAGISSVTFELSGGTLRDQIVATATPTIYGWLAQWNTTAVPNGTYILESVAADSGGVIVTSSGITISVNNPALADLANSSFTATPSAVFAGNGCSFVYVAFDAAYTGSAAVGNVTLHIAGCATPDTYAGSFTITTDVGTLSGSANGPIITPEGTTLSEIYQITLSVGVATGAFSRTMGNLLFSTSSDSSVASVSVE